MPSAQRNPNREVSSPPVDQAQKVRLAAPRQNAEDAAPDRRIATHLDDPRQEQDPEEVRVPLHTLSRVEHEAVSLREVAGVPEGDERVVDQTVVQKSVDEVEGTDESEPDPDGGRDVVRDLPRDLLRTGGGGLSRSDFLAGAGHGIRAVNLQPRPRQGQSLHRRGDAPSDHCRIIALIEEAA
jgi:hypothetical protein